MPMAVSAAPTDGDGTRGVSSAGECTHFYHTRAARGKILPGEKRPPGGPAGGEGGGGKGPPVSETFRLVRDRPGAPRAVPRTPRPWGRVSLARRRDAWHDRAGLPRPVPAVRAMAWPCKTEPFRDPGQRAERFWLLLVGALGVA